MNQLECNDIMVKINSNEINLLDGIQFVSSPKCGAIITFSGTIRDQDMRPRSDVLEPIGAIHYEAYESMAKKQILNIIKETIRTNLNLEPGTNSDCQTRAYVGVRLGSVRVGETSLVICVSSIGRRFAHWATMEILNKIKSSVAIWKKIIFADGSAEWIDDKRSEASWLQPK